MSIYTSQYEGLSTKRLQHKRSLLKLQETDALAAGEGKTGEAFRNVIRQGTELRLRRIAVEDILRSRGETVA